MKNQFFFIWGREGYQAFPSFLVMADSKDEAILKIFAALNANTPEEKEQVRETLRRLVFQMSERIPNHTTATEVIK